MIAYLLGTEHLIMVLLYFYSIFKASAFYSGFTQEIGGFFSQNRGNMCTQHHFLKQIKSQHFQCNQNLIIILNI